jgi:hypothetical protein
MKQTIPQSIETALRAAGVYPFRAESMHADYNAERNLSGRTHFCDPATRKYFKARVLNSGVSDDGLVFWLIESNRSKPFDSKRNKRFVAFDVFGTVLNDREEWHATSAQAYKDGMDWLKRFDSRTHTRLELAGKARRDIKAAEQIIEALEAPLNA